MGIFHRAALAAIAASAFVAIWGGWVLLGHEVGFGPVVLLPGIAPLRFDLSIALPAGVEAYAALAYGVWLRRPGLAFAKWSALGASALGAFGQAAGHVLVAERHGAGAPTWLVVLVSVLPVITLALATMLMEVVASADAGPDANAELEAIAHAWGLPNASALLEAIANARAEREANAHAVLAELEAIANAWTPEPYVLAAGAERPPALAFANAELEANANGRPANANGAPDRAAVRERWAAGDLDRPGVASALGISPAAARSLTLRWSK